MNFGKIWQNLVQQKNIKFSFYTWSPTCLSKESLILSCMVHLCSCRECQFEWYHRTSGVPLSSHLVVSLKWPQAGRLPVPWLYTGPWPHLWAYSLPGPRWQWPRGHDDTHGQGQGTSGDSHCVCPSHGTGHQTPGITHLVCWQQRHPVSALLCCWGYLFLSNHFNL